MTGEVFMAVLQTLFGIYFVVVIVMLVRLNIRERMSRGISLGQALKDIAKDTFYIQQIGKK